MDEYVRTEGVWLDARGVLGVLKHLDFEDLSKKSLKGAIRTELKAARKETVTGLRAIVGHTGKDGGGGDPRGAYKAVKMMVYRGGGRSSEGGNISILNAGGAKSMGLDKPRRKGVASGITRKRPISDRTKQIRGYRGRDRAFILRFLNQGTDMRETRFGRRGRLPVGDFFGRISGTAMKGANERLTSRIEKLIAEVGGK